MGYVALLWQDLLVLDRELRRARRLPPVLPVVIHSGATPWRAATDIGELLPVLPDGLASYAPRMKYLLRFAVEASDAVRADDGEVIRSTISIGVGARQPGEANFDAILQRADRAVYEAKNGGTQPGEVDRCGLSAALQLIEEQASADLGGGASSVQPLAR